MSVLRELGRHERYSVARTQYGSPPIITLAAVLTTHEQDAQPILDHVHQRVDRILEGTPLLRCGIAQAESNRPRYCLLATAPTPTDIVKLRDAVSISAQTENGPDEVARLRTLRDELMSKEQVNWMQHSIKSLQHVLWTVALYPIQGLPRSTFVLLVSLNHSLADGRGVFNILNGILSNREPLLDNNQVPPTSDSSFDMDQSPPEPSYSDDLKSAPFWPEKILQNLLDCPTAMKSIDLDSTFSSKLKAIATQHGIKTLHPVLETAAILALGMSASEAAEEQKEFVIASSTAISLRGSTYSSAPLASHGHFAGNWVGGRDDRTLCNPTLKFWARARRAAGVLADPTTLQKAILVWKGVDGLPSSTGVELDGQIDALDQTPLQGDGWAQMMRQHVGKTPHISTYHASLGISNLGFFALDRDGREDSLFTVDHCSWTQVASPIADCICLNIIGAGRPKATTPADAGNGVPDGSVAAATAVAERQPALSQAATSVGGISLNLAYRQGSVDQQIIDKFHTTLTKLLHLVADGQVGEEDDVAKLRSILASE
ncbi:hypothetical protein OC846_000947 [Tilletia horrida]|uniref:Uncharacterized protein n=1 Tax=Tilletia horrida TaxID=155126 RepID=A0AAN6JTG2_9BASI|nr:hypothetical protein OC845_000857 [Tilletia horrida]KAK0556759.1 hypothetical protein OC846_000947 [Tilletia horrida]